ncbi:hypothetical protein BD410DRAFT_443134 [Rickenella mellea]|uniref:Uncharacterized protein n=1 Tax=Rickenella mellea TaxID=50990 RepID=A0A4Y7PW46_9AGAM|nr:hypothetical protein BD410DRAFT_443134 [Rickenella mellea]
MDDLDALLKLLNRVKARGWTVALAQASEGKDRHKISVENYPPYSEPLITLRQEMEQARVCLKALEDIRCRLKQRLRALRRMGHNMAITGGCQFSLDVSHVSRRLRRISLQTPLLWTRIKESYSESQIREFISRSGRRDLDIGIFTASRIPSSRTEVFLQLVGEYSHRWSSINIVDMASESMMTKLGITNLPRLRYVSHTYDVSFSTWSTPALAHVEGWSCLLPAGSSILMQLTHFELNLSEDAVDIQDLAKSYVT